MSTHYEILQVSETASLDIIKQRFQQLILQHHPDKRITDDDNDQAHKILKAWEILRNPSMRKNYDIELQSMSNRAQFISQINNLLYDIGQRNKKDLAIGAEVDLDEMEYDEASLSYLTDCRCSGDYIITENELEAGIEVVGCNNCSLKIRVLYDVVEDDDGVL